MAATNLSSTVLNSTNTYREIHRVDPLTWNTTLADFAQEAAQACIFKHSGGPYGENLAGGYPTPTLAIDAWANEEPLYSYKKQKFTEKNGHFTQLVWANTTDVGCANVNCGNEGGGEGELQGDFLICEYWPRGNVQGQFGDNVLKPVGSGAWRGRGSMGWWAWWGVAVMVLGML
ncbi:related to the plant PR-1 class of pathogen related proteins [Ramularia collo-cygni]|uniref:Related to the plant PR-1 class of pathogen related proteins n=1 Tax=Ramularia collo-cygni TaxID=112498 RepID=A0A2D3VCK2_9PEZI|nr:related to the plant PR-1 class of pathogen related proteins [Ramularia collo-cygni]CZT18243.1 related to the plant PR-1 class of pathogen related proteins [Ramularia collo-cygni]